ncbi:hypothetical protein ABW21_db0205438 [Orbilia brochopaga]|nr:hypothetical protein ABW21_db0205438 [Drechslerella brochopaga]
MIDIGPRRQLLGPANGMKQPILQLQREKRGTFASSLRAPITTAQQKGRMDGTKESHQRASSTQAGRGRWCRTTPPASRIGLVTSPAALTAARKEACTVECCCLHVDC